MDIKLSAIRKVSEKEVLKFCIKVHKIKKISEKQLLDIFNAEPNYLGQVTEKVNRFIELVCIHILLEKEKDSLSDKLGNNAYAEKHTEYEKRIHDIKDFLSPVWVQRIEMDIVFDAIGKFLVNTKYFEEMDEIHARYGRPSKSPKNFSKRENEEQHEKFMDMIGKISAYVKTDKYKEDEIIDIKASRYAYFLFKTLIATGKKILPKDVTIEEFSDFFSEQIYNEEDDQLMRYAIRKGFGE